MSNPVRPETTEQDTIENETSDTSEDQPSLETSPEVSLPSVGEEASREPSRLMEQIEKIGEERRKRRKPKGPEKPGVLDSDYYRAQ